MTVSIKRLRRLSETLQNIIDEADARGIEKVKTSPNTYRLSEFVSCESDGFLDLNADVDDLLEDEDEE